MKRYTPRPAAREGTGETAAGMGNPFVLAFSIGVYQYVAVEAPAADLHVPNPTRAVLERPGAAHLGIVEVSDEAVAIDGPERFDLDELRRSDGSPWKIVTGDPVTTTYNAVACEAGGPGSPGGRQHGCPSFSESLSFTEGVQACALPL